MFMKENADEDRGKFYFTQRPNEDENMGKLGNSYLRLALDCIWVWSKWFPIDPSTLQLSQYKISFEKLIQLDVHFSKLIYFTYYEIEPHIPETSVPIKILQECREVI